MQMESEFVAANWRFDGLGRFEVARKNFLESKIEPSTKPPGDNHHGSSDEDNHAKHDDHQEVDIGLVLSIFCALLGFRYANLASDTTLSVFRRLAGEDALNELLNL